MTDTLAPQGEGAACAPNASLRLFFMRQFQTFLACCLDGGFDRRDFGNLPILGPHTPAPVYLVVNYARRRLL